MATIIADQLRTIGFDLVVPHEIMHGGDQHENPTYSHADYIREDIRLGLAHCDAIALVDGWVHSRGCLDEFTYARMMGMRIFFVDRNWNGGHFLIEMDGKGNW
jgi:hypothetical protein